MAALDESPGISGPAVQLRMTGTNAAPRSCVLLGLAHGKMHIRSGQWIEPGSEVSALVARITVSGQVDYCTRKDNWYRICIAITSDNYESRRAPRFPFRQPGKATVLSGDGEQSAAVMLLDLSVSGIRLEVPYYIETGKMIFVETEGALMVGEVRHCRKAPRGSFEVGIEVTDILSDITSPQNSPRLLNGFRRRIARAIRGDSARINGKPA